MKRKPITAGEWFGCGKVITQESWDAFIAARKEYYDQLDYYDRLDAENTLPGSPAPKDSIVQEGDGSPGELGLTETKRPKRKDLILNYRRFSHRGI